MGGTWRALEPHVAPMCITAGIPHAEAGLVESSRPRASVRGTAHVGRPAQNLSHLLTAGLLCSSWRETCCADTGFLPCVFPPPGPSRTRCHIKDSGSSPQLQPGPPPLPSTSVPSRPSLSGSLSLRPPPITSPSVHHPPQIREIEIKNWTS